MSAGDEETQASGEQTIRQIWRGIQAAQLQVALDEARGPADSQAVKRLARTKLLTLM
jgi:hypothetical protein